MNVKLRAILIIALVLVALYLAENGPGGTLGTIIYTGIAIGAGGIIVDTAKNGSKNKKGESTKTED